jgi:hypothetical protein
MNSSNKTKITTIRKYILTLSVIGSLLAVLMYYIFFITPEENHSYCGVIDQKESTIIDSNTFIEVTKIINSRFDASLGRDLYKANCGACHAFDKKVVGPALDGFIERIPNKSIIWLKRFLREEKAMNDDKYVIQLKKEYNTEYNHDFFVLNDGQLKDLIGYTLINPQVVN